VIDSKRCPYLHFHELEALQVIIDAVYERVDREEGILRARGEMVRSREELKRQDF
jgi:hypothetical protein